MKNVLLSALAIGILLTGCQTAPGPAGATGLPGATGPQGPTGNANVQQYIFGSRTVTTQTAYTVPGITQTQLDSSIVLAYHQSANGYWFAVPGPSGGSYDTKMFMEISQGLRSEITLFSYTTGSYNTPTTWAAFRVIIIPSSSNVTLLKTGGLNLNDYNAVRKYYNLPE